MAEASTDDAAIANSGIKLYLVSANCRTDDVHYVAAKRHSDNDVIEVYMIVGDGDSHGLYDTLRRGVGLSGLYTWVSMWVVAEYGRLVCIRSLSASEWRNDECSSDSVKSAILLATLQSCK